MSTNKSNKSKLFPGDIVVMQMLGFATSPNVHPESSDLAYSMYESTTTGEYQPSITRLKENGIISQNRDGNLYFTKRGRRKYAKHTTTPSDYLRMRGFEDFSNEEIVDLLPKIIRQVVERQKSDDFMMLLGQDILDNVEKFNLLTTRFAEVCEESVGMAQLENELV